MPVFSEQIHNYRLDFVHSRSLDQPSLHKRHRHIVLKSTFGWNFVLKFVADATVTTGDLTKAVKDGITAYSARMHIPIGEYADYIDLVRHEKPIWISFAYHTEPAAGKSTPIQVCHIFTNEDEPIGEGPEDESA